MKRMFAAVLLAGSILSGCSKPESSQSSEPAAGEMAQAPMIAYGYTYRFTLPGQAVGQAQDRHIAMCDRMGPARCRMLEMHRNSREGRSDGSTRFIVAAGDARQFGQDIGAPVAALGGKLSSRDFEAEDLSKQNAESQAKVAEKDNADHRAALSAVRERLETSPIWIYYDGTTRFWAQIGDALGAAGDTVTISIVALIYFLAGALPWILVLSALFFAVRAIARRVSRRPRPARSIKLEQPAEAVPTADRL